MKGPTNEELIAQYREEENPFKKEFIREDFFIKNEKLSHYIANKYKNSIVPYEDSVALCHIGMTIAFDLFDLSKGFKFATYAPFIMEREILKEIRRLKKHQGVLSLDDVAFGPHNDDANLSLLDMIADDLDLEQDVENAELVRIFLEGQQHFLSEKERQSILNLVEDEVKSQTEISKDMGVTQAQVSRLKRRALDKAKTYLNEHKVSEDMKKKKPKKKVKRMRASTIEIKIPEGTTYEKVKFLVEHYPGMKPVEIVKHTGIPKATVYTYMSQVRREQGKEKVKTPAQKVHQMVTNEVAAAVEQIKVDRPVIRQEEKVQEVVTNEPVKEAIVEETPKRLTPSAEIPKRHPVLVGTRQESSSPSLVSLSLKDVSSSSLETTVKHLMAMLQENELYDLTIDITKQ